MKRKKLENILTTIIFMLMCVGAGGFGGYAMVKLIPKDAPTWQEMLAIFMVMIIFYIVLILHIFIHETGHMICGLISGYKFSSIRFFCFMFVKEDGKLRVKKLSIAGTGGQCLMTPPAIDGTSPVSLYNWGGCLANVIVSAVSIVVAVFIKELVVLQTIMLMMGVVGICLAIINGIPLKTLSNDGYNAITLKKRPEARKAFEKSLYITNETATGKRLKDMPAEFFDYEIGAYELDDNMLITNAVMTLEYYVDCMNLEKVYELSKYLYENVQLVDAHKLVAIGELISSILMTDRDKAEIDKILTEENKKLLKIFKAQPSVHRVWYIYDLLVNGDMEKAQEHRKNYEKLIVKYPYQSDLESEVELMNLALEKYENSKEA